MALVLYYNDMLQKVTMQRTQLNAAHAQLLVKLRSIAFAETWGFLTIQSFEFQEIWQKKKEFRNHVNDLSRKIWILT